MRRCLLTFGIFITCFATSGELDAPRNTETPALKSPMVTISRLGINFTGPQGMINHYQWVLFIDQPQVLPLEEPFNLIVKRSATECDNIQKYSNRTDIARVILTTIIQTLGKPGQLPLGQEEVRDSEDFSAAYGEFTAGHGVSLSGPLDKLASLLRKIPPFIEPPRILELQEPFNLTIRKSETESHDAKEYTDLTDIARVILTVNGMLEKTEPLPKERIKLKDHQDFSTVYGKFTAGYGLSLSGPLDGLSDVLCRMPPFNNKKLLSLQPLEMEVLKGKKMLSQLLNENYWELELGNNTKIIESKPENQEKGANSILQVFESENSHPVRTASGMKNLWGLLRAKSS